jgi:tetratricopeptide (TPR) repeat protein
MNTRQIYYLTGGLILFAAGLLVVGLDYERMRTDFTGKTFTEGAIANDRGEGRRPKPYSEEELRSDMLRAEEYLRQNSRDSATKAMELYTSILSYDTDRQVNQVARYGLAAALYRLGDDRRALEHLRILKREDIKDRALSENVDFLLGRILLLAGHEDEGRSILQSLLSRTTDRIIQSRIHSAFGDYYIKKGEREKAKKSYRIAVEYYPDNFHAVFSGESARRFADMTEFDTDRMDLHLADDIFSRKETKKTDTKKDKKDRKKPVTSDQPANPSQEEQREKADFLRAEELYGKGLNLMRRNQHRDALRYFLEAADLLNGLDPEKLKDVRLRSRIYNRLEHVYYRAGEASASLGDLEQAHHQFDRVLSNPDASLDQASLVRKGILFFDGHQYESAYRLFNRAVQEFPDGSYTRRAEQWMRETENFLKNQTP